MKNLFKWLMVGLVAVVLAGCGGEKNTDKVNIDYSWPPKLYNVRTYVIATVDSAITPIEFTNTGGTIASCSVSPSLPTGLSIDSATCTISGTPTVIQDQTIYGVTATNARGSDTVVVRITINPLVPNISNHANVTTVVDSAITPIRFTNTGGAIDTCRVDPLLPDGLIIDNTTCTISGTPTTTQAETIYTVIASNAGGVGGASVKITIRPSADHTTWTTGAYSNDANMSHTLWISGASSLRVTISGETEETHDFITIYGEDGSQVGRFSGSINETFDVSGSSVLAVLTSDNSVTGSGVTVSISSITPPLSPPDIADAADVIAVTNTAITPIEFTNTGGEVTSCSVSPALPAGLSVGVNNDTCEITGTPTAITTQAIYTITGTNGTGNDTATVDITIADIAPSLADASAQTYAKGTSITPLAFANTGGAVTSCSVSAALPAGLSVGVSNDTCEITGTPTAITAQKTYTITGTNGTGSDAATVDITVNDDADNAPNLANSSAKTYAKGTAITPLAFTNTGGAVTSCSVSAALPAGLSVGVSNDTCEITGTPTAITAQKTYTITGTNGTGNDTATVDITVNNDADGDYIPDDIEAMLNMSSSNSDEDGDGILDGLQLTGNKGDDFFDKQWHIRSTGINSSPDPDSTTIAGNDLGVMDIYHNYMGYNGGNPLVVQVVDTGVDADHEDLVDNMDLSLSRNSDTQTMGDPVETADSSHGTMCAGIIGARAFNGKGVRGVAPFVKIAGSNWLSSSQTYAELEEAWTRNDPDGKIILASNSWGHLSADSSTYYEDFMLYGANNLRKVGGVDKGKLFIKAAGNGRGDGHDSGLSYSSSNPYVITVAGLKNDNTHASYSSPGSNILVSGYSGNYFSDSATIGTTYIAGRSALAENLTWNNTRECLERSSDNKCSMPTWEDDNSDTKSYTYGMNGTSAATPTVAGSLALVLEACPSLSWRDVKYLIAKNAIKVDSSNSSWITNGAGLHHSVDYGFGLINPSAMINECKGSYTELPVSSTFSESFDPDPDIAIPDNDANGISYDFTVLGNKVIEWLGVTITSNHTWAGDLEIYLTSPAGTTTRLMKGQNSGGDYSMTAGFRYGSVAFMGESSVGTWSIKIADIVEVDVGNLENLIFSVFGH